MLAILTITFNKARGFSEVNGKWAVRQRFRSPAFPGPFYESGPVASGRCEPGKLRRIETLMRLFATKGL